MMSTKSLSTSTLSLRFMQNADRAKNLKQVEAEKAQIKSDAEWEVAKEVQEAWGIDSTSEARQTVTYEPSYMPFLFPSLADASSEPALKTNGRRAFNKHGQEIIDEQAPPTTALPTSRDRPNSRLHSISGSSSSSSRLSRPIESKKVKEKESTKSAQQSIYDNTGVGIDIRTPGHAMPPPPPPSTSSSNPPHTSAIPSGFLKPAGFDDPKPTPRISAQDTGVVMGARSKISTKRAISGTDPSDGEPKKRKKKRKSAE